MHKGEDSLLSRLLLIGSMNKTIIIQKLYTWYCNHHWGTGGSCLKIIWFFSQTSYSDLNYFFAIIIIIIIIKVLISNYLLIFFPLYINTNPPQLRIIIIPCPLCMLTSHVLYESSVSHWGCWPKDWVEHHVGVCLGFPSEATQTTGSNPCPSSPYHTQY